MESDCDCLMWRGRAFQTFWTYCPCNAKIDCKWESKPKTGRPEEPHVPFPYPDCSITTAVRHVTEKEKGRGEAASEVDRVTEQLVQSSVSRVRLAQSSSRLVSWSSIRIDRPTRRVVHRRCRRVPGTIWQFHMLPPLPRYCAALVPSLEPGDGTRWYCTFWPSRAIALSVSPTASVLFSCFALSLIFVFILEIFLLISVSSTV